MFRILLIALVLSLASFGQQSTEAVALEAKQALSKGDFDRAAALYRKLCAEMPDVAGLRLNLGIALYSARHLDAAAVELRKARQLDPALTPAALFLGLTLARAGRSAEAIEPLEVALRAEPNNRTILLETADAYLTTNQPAVGAKRFRRLTEIDPRNPTAWRGLGLASAALARDSFAKLPQDSAASLVLLARARLDEQKTATAFGLLRRAIAKDSVIPGAHGLLAEVYRQTNHADWAAVEDARERAITRRPEGLYAEAVDASAESLRAFSRLTELPESAELHETEADAARLRGAYTEAVEALRKASRLKPGDPRLERELARSLWLAADYANAMPLLEKYGLDFERGYALLQSGNAAEAVAPLERASRKDKRPEVMAALGKAYMAVSQPARAIDALKAGLTSDSDGSVHFQLARAYQRAGRTQEARAMDAESQKLRTAFEERRSRIAQESEIGPPQS